MMHIRFALGLLVLLTGCGVAEGPRTGELEVVGKSDDTSQIGEYDCGELQVAFGFCECEGDAACLGSCYKMFWSDYPQAMVGVACCDMGLIDEGFCAEKPAVLPQPDPVPAPLPPHPIDAYDCDELREGLSFCDCAKDPDCLKICFDRVWAEEDQAKVARTCCAMGQSFDGLCATDPQLLVEQPE